jgi:hypothetical protein
MGRLRCNLGINPMGLQWHLLPGTPSLSVAVSIRRTSPLLTVPDVVCAMCFPGQSFNTPEAVLTRSSEGLGGLSRCIHRLFLDRLLPRNWSDAEPPILINSWEAKYFHVNHHNIVEMAQQVSFTPSGCVVQLNFLQSVNPSHGE